MKPLKQVVYLPTSKETITAVCNFDNHWSHHEYVEYKEGYFFTSEQLNEYTANVIKQALETAAKNSYVEYIDLETNEVFDYTDVITDDGVGANVCKKSITNTFDKTFKQFEV